jgi:hypothetical protein
VNDERVQSRDLTGGLDASADEVTAQTPSSPDFREGVSMWIWDDAGRIGLPRVAVEAVGATWETSRGATLNLTTPDGRVLLAWANEPPHPTVDREGRPRRFGAGPLRFECVEPFSRWRVVFDGLAMETTVRDQIAGRAPLLAPSAQVVDDEDDRRDPVPLPQSLDSAALGKVPVGVDIDTRMAAPPWVQGSLGGEGFIPGEDRFEQLFWAEGMVRVDGQEIPIAGGGLRIHRKGGNRTDPSDFFGHCWHSAIFPSGRSFGFIHYFPRPDGSKKFCEGWVTDRGTRLAAQVLDTPWLQRMQPSGEDIGFTLRTDRDDVHVEGETFMSAFFPLRQMGKGVNFPPLQQGIARYRWEGEEAYGMIERSAYIDP